MPRIDLDISRRAALGMIATVPLLLANAPQSGNRNRQRLMIQGRPQDSGSLYKVPNIMRAFDQLGGVRLMRCREPFSKTVGWNSYIGLAHAGVRFCFTLAARDPQRSLADLRAFLHAAPGSIWAIEFPNEPDLNPVAFNGVRDARLGFRRGVAPSFMAYIAAMHALLAGDPEFGKIPIIASNDYMQKEQAALTTFGNSHIYPHETSSVAQLLQGFQRTVMAGGHRQGVITEWGRTTGGDPRNVTAAPITPSRQADLLASDLTAIFADPIVATVSLYELFSWPGTGEQTNFGLFDADLKPRPVVAAIRTLLT